MGTLTGLLIGLTAGLWLGHVLESFCWIDKARNGQRLLRWRRFYRIVQVHDLPRE